MSAESIRIDPSPIGSGLRRDHSKDTVNSTPKVLGRDRTPSCRYQYGVLKCWSFSKFLPNKLMDRFSLHLILACAPSSFTTSESEWNHGVGPPSGPFTNRF